MSDKCVALTCVDAAQLAAEYDLSTMTRVASNQCPPLRLRGAAHVRRARRSGTLQLHLLARRGCCRCRRRCALRLRLRVRRMSRRCLRCGALGARAAAIANSSANACGSGGQDDVEGETAALSFDVERLSRVYLRLVAAEVGSLAFRKPFVASLVPADTPEMRGTVGFSVIYRIDAVLEIFAVCARRVLLRRVMSKLCPFANCPPFVRLLVPADAFDLRCAPYSALSGSGNTAVLEVLAIRASRSFLRGVIAQVFLLACCLPFAAFF